MLQEDLTDEMVDLARQLKESSLLMSQSVKNTEKVSSILLLEHEIFSSVLWIVSKVHLASLLSFLLALRCLEKLYLVIPYHMNMISHGTYLPLLGST